MNNSHFYKVKRADPVHACLLFYANNAWRSEFEYKTRLLNYNTFFSLLLQMSHACFTYESVKFACFVRFLGVVLNNLYYRLHVVLFSNRTYVRHHLRGYWCTLYVFCAQSIIVRDYKLVNSTIDNHILRIDCNIRR